MFWIFLFLVGHAQNTSGSSTDMAAYGLKYEKSYKVFWVHFGLGSSSGIVGFLGLSLSFFGLISEDKVVDCELCSLTCVGSDKDRGEAGLGFFSGRYLVNKFCPGNRKDVLLDGPFCTRSFFTGRDAVVIRELHSPCRPFFTGRDVVVFRVLHFL